MPPRCPPGLLALPLLLGVLSAPAGCAPPTRAAATAPPGDDGRPTLVVLVTIDQFRADYLERFGAQLTGGLGRLVRGGASFTNAHHDHAITETAPGHATLLAGRFPRSTGITMNSVGVEDAAHPLLDAGYGPGASPRRFAGSTLVDWVRAQDARSRTLSVSVKDRGAILPVGRSRSDVYWYSPDGRFLTSTWYRSALPDWVHEFNARQLPQRYAGRAWTLLRPEGAYPERDSVAAEGDGADVAFPHRLPADSLEAASLVRVTPFIDEVTVAFALQGVTALRLGAGPQTDILAISLSATDFIGHRYGPDSREIHDQVLRTDRTLGVLLDSLYRLRDSSRVVVVLTADHGVATIPEVAAAAGASNARRVSLYSQVMPSARRYLLAAGIDTLALRLDWQLVTVNRAAFRDPAGGADSALAWFAAAARGVPGVRRVDDFRALRADSLRHPLARRWSHQLPRDAAVDLVVTLDSLSSWGGNIASHGSAYDHDSHVPLIFYGPGIRAGRHAGFVRTVDIAPTLAARLGVHPTERTDGVVLRQALP